MSESTLEEIYNFLPISERIGTAGQPTEAQLPAIVAAGYQVVVNLLPETSGEALSGEREQFEAEGLGYISIPVFWTEPTLTDLEEFFAVMETNAERRVFVHCAANMRVSAFIYLYRTLRLHVPEEEAAQDLKRIWTPNPIWQRLLQQAIAHYGFNV